ncbi:MAG TPA: hypothetical protein VHB48_09755 [Chitinophagaceae bacterium]|nr:hypothetical protein [Chitinophagaceae bacterium]
MNKAILLILLVFATAVAGTCFAQTPSSRSKKIPTTGVVQLDTLSIVKESFYIPGVDTALYRLDFVNAELFWKKNTLQDSITVKYRVFPFRLNARAHRYLYDSIKNNFIAAPSYTSRQNTANNSLLNFGKLNYNGSFGRSLSFGNNQDAVFNSQLNLQLDGYIGDSILLSAAITDNNIPIQPDGTTQQLNEFDKILLQFRKKNWEINLGDIDLRQDNAYFLHFYKRLQGISYTQQFNLGQNITNKTVLSGAIAKGKFARNVLQVQEGNQGPYRLQGNNNELFFIVLAGTERVYINGVQMQRGEDQDYVINYNTAEITFTPKHLISQDSRVQVEFEYADRNYLNSMLYASNETDFGNRFKLTVSIYNNADAKNSPINQPLDNNQKQFLADLGDSIQNAYYPVASIDSFSTSSILYKKIDTVTNGIHDSIYVYSTNRDSAKYNLAFAEVGINKGNYMPLFNAANGKVYQWVAPVNGVPQGNYEAAAFLVTPKRQTVMNVAGEYKINDKTTLRAEIAASDYDANTFSTIGKTNDKGYAARLTLIHNDSWKTRHDKLMHFEAIAGYEFTGKNFQPVETLRPVEFGRDWGLGYLLTPADEQLPSLHLKLSDEKDNSIAYDFTSYLRSDGFTGIRNVTTHTQNFGGWHLTDILNLTNSNTHNDKGYYFRPTIDLNKTFTSFHNYTIGANYAVEHNETRNNIADTVTPLSFAFETLSAYIKSNQALPNKWSFTYYTRSDQLPGGKNLLQADRSHNYSFQTELLKNPHNQFRLTVTYRQFMVNNTSLITQTPDNSLLGRAEYIVNKWHGFLTGNVLYEMGAGQEQKLDYTYIQVPAGQGQYTWIDLNGDGIAQLNEFELAVFQDQATYIRVYTPTNEFIKADYTQFNYSFMLTPKALSANIHSSKWANFINRFILQSSMQTYKKQVSDGNPVFNPFKGKIQDTALIAYNFILSNTLSFNRYSTNWGVDVTNLINYNKSLLTYGTETKQLNEWDIKGRLNIAKVYTLELVQKFLGNNLYTPSFANQNYSINEYSAQPQLTYTSGTKYRLMGGYVYDSKKNAMQYGGEKATTNSLTLQGKYNIVSNTSLTAGFTLSNIDFNGTPNTTVSYIMLDALLPGKNYLWNISLTKRLINNLELTFEYEGRKPGETRVINTGRASLRALL